jgi:hypothetical protein
VVSTAAIIRGLKIAGILAVIFLCELLVIIGCLAFVLGAINDQPDASVYGFIIAAFCGYMIRCLFEPLMKVIDEK